MREAMQLKSFSYRKCFKSTDWMTLPRQGVGRETEEDLGRSVRSWGKNKNQQKGERREQPVGWFVSFKMKTQKCV